MKEDVLLRTLLDQKADALAHPVVHRNIPLEDGVNYCFTGIRRAGKSFLMYQRMHELLASGIAEDDLLYVNFEDERLVEMRREDLNLLLKLQAGRSSGRPWIFLDEIQVIPGWEKFVRRLADAGQHVCVSGSNAVMLSSQIATTLGGRLMICHVWPYSFPEFLTASGIDSSPGKLATTKGEGIVAGAFTRYLQFGALPVLVGIREKRNFLESVYQTVYLKDVITRNSLTNEFAVRLTLKKVAESIGHPLSYNRLANILKSAGFGIAKTTVVRHISCMQDAFLLFQVVNYGSKLIDRETAPKFYFADTGFLGLLNNDPLSAAFENLAAIELVRRYGQKQVFFWSTDVEVDFLVPDASLAIQVCLQLQPGTATYDREIRALVRLNRRMPGLKLLILTLDEEESAELDGCHIEILPMWKWLLHA